MDLNKDEMVFLIKFVQKYKHAKNLVDGCIYMRTAEFYKNHYDSDAKDPYEGNISHQTMIALGTNHYIYSTFLVTKKMLTTNFKIEKSLIQHFNCENGYAVVINFEKFGAILKQQKNTSRYSLTGFPIKYGYIRSIETTKYLLLNNKFVLSVKIPKFAFENEYRFVSGKCSNNPNIPYRLKLSTSLINCSKIIKLNSFFEKNDNVDINDLINAK